VPKDAAPITDIADKTNNPSIDFITKSFVLNLILSKFLDYEFLDTETISDSCSIQSSLVFNFSISKSFDSSFEILRF